MNKWYSDNLGLVTNQYGSLFEFRKADEPHSLAYLQWSTMKKDSSYFDPSTKDFMINYRVENIESLLVELKSKGVEVLDKIESFEYGKFVHLLDPEGNKIELWEHVDELFGKLSGGVDTSE